MLKRVPRSSDQLTVSPGARAIARGRDDADRARVVADYIAGMTDRYALKEHERLTAARIG